jgi:TonB family protein
VEALTQHRPVWNEHQLEELFKRIPDPFLDIARNCLKRDPQKRWTVANCLARLRQTGDASPNDAAPTKPQAAVLSGRYVIPVIGVVLVLAAILAAPRVLKRQPDTGPTPSTLIEQPVQRGDDGEEAGPSPQSAIEPDTSEGDIIPLEVVEQVLPEVPKSASDTIQGTVRVSVKVTVNASGDVAEVELDTPGPSRYFANLALQAAQHWKFAAAKSDRRDVPREVILRFEFTRTATRGFAAQVH